MGGIIINEIGEMRAYAADKCNNGKSVGLVPTMGALHEGHLSLVRRSASENAVTIVSVFVNPIQFDDPADFAAYPKTLGADAAAAFKAGADVVFAPDPSSMYPKGFSTFVDMTGISERLCGASRASHFKGVLTVVSMLFGIFRPGRAYFGEKDAQQLAVVKKMAAELFMNVEVVGCPTVREPDGLAMSSRNARLSDDERIEARRLFRALSEAKACFDAGNTDPESLIAVVRASVETCPLARIDYVELVDPGTFGPFGPGERARAGDLLMLAVFIGAVRLIDNVRL